MGKNDKSGKPSFAHIDISIKGPPQVGKSTIAEALASVLEDNGYEVTVDGTTPKGTKAEYVGDMQKGKFDGRGHKVTIKTLSSEAHGNPPKPAADEAKKAA